MLKAVFMHMKPVSQAPYFIAGLSLLSDIAYRLIHDIVLSIFVSDMQVGKDEFFQHALLTLQKKIVLSCPRGGADRFRRSKNARFQAADSCYAGFR